MLGTAFPASRILLVEQPGGWGPAGLLASQFDPRLATELANTFGKLGIRVLAIRRPGRTPASERRSWGLADCRPGSQSMTWGSFGADAELLEPLVGVRDDRPVYAVCAHGTHDMCCAIQGRPVAAALERQCPGRVWECSHVGGDRFSANVLVLPTGQQYGRVEETTTGELVEATEAGRVLPRLLRGQVGLAPAVQAAIAHAQQELGLTGIGQVRGVGSAPGEDGNQLVRLETERGNFTVAVQKESGLPARLTCRADMTRVPLSYRPLSLTPS
jgi:hypothetical protein